MSWPLRALVILPICLPLCTQAHMKMSSPYALRSPLDPAVPERYKDYSITNPLMSDGSNFPCKHYQYNNTNSQAYDIKATYQAGSNYNLSLAGGATHLGGSCQISLSYDNGATFKVIQSIVGGCPLAYTYPFTIPSFAPSSSSALLSWSWFNLVGNREMYQNCARVQIQGTPVQRYRRTEHRRQTSFDQLPDMFVCNVGNGCRTVENAEVVFPNPGPNIIYGRDAVTPQPGPGFILDGSVSITSALSTTSSAPFPVFNTSTVFGPTGTGYTNYTTGALTTSSSPPTSTPTSSSTESSTASTSTTTRVIGPVTTTITRTATPTPVGTETASSTLSTIVVTLATVSSTSTSVIARDTSAALSGTTFTTLTVTTSASSTPPSSTTLPSTCVPGTFTCNSPNTFSQCVAGGTYTYMGSVAAGMQCVNGQIVRQNFGPCTPNGQIFCNGRNAFYMCDQGGLINMGPVAPGTSCSNGAIVRA